jgi:hypothetical protein
MSAITTLVVNLYHMLDLCSKGPPAATGLLLQEPDSTPPSAGLGSTIFPDQFIGGNDRPLIEVATPAPQRAGDAGNGIQKFIDRPVSRSSLVDPFERALHKESRWAS